MQKTPSWTRRRGSRAPNRSDDIRQPKDAEGASGVMHQNHPPGHLPEHHRSLPVATHLPVDVVVQRVDSDLALVRRLALEPPEQCVGEQPMPYSGGLLGLLARGTGGDDQFAVALDHL